MSGKRWSRRSVFAWMTLALTLGLFGQSVAGVMLLRNAYFAESEEKTPAETATESWILEGVVIRQEQPLEASLEGNWVILPEEGSAVAAGGLLAVDMVRGILTPGWSLETETEDALKQPLPLRRGLLREAIGESQQAPVSGARNVTAQILEAIPEPGTPLWNGEIRSPCSGIFARGGDTLTQLLSGKTPEELLAFYDRLPEALPVPQMLGRVITHETWYLLVELPFAPETGERLRGLLLSGVFSEADFLVECSRDTEGGALAVLSCRALTDKISDIRYLTVKFQGI